MLRLARKSLDRGRGTKQGNEMVATRRHCFRAPKKTDLSLPRHLFPQVALLPFIHHPFISMEMKEHQEQELEM
jgi:hypothetical protein